MLQISQKGLILQPTGLITPWYVQYEAIYTAVLRLLRCIKYLSNSKFHVHVRLLVRVYLRVVSISVSMSVYVSCPFPFPGPFLCPCQFKFGAICLCLTWQFYCQFTRPLWGGLLHEKGWVKSAENFSASLSKRDLSNDTTFSQTNLAGQSLKKISPQREF